jgi:hypothetical protein
MPPARSLLALVIAFLLVASCGLFTEPHTEPRFGARAIPPELYLINTGTEPAYYFVVERDLLSRINWAPCVDPEYCRHVPPKGEVAVPYTSITGYSPEAKSAVVYWWNRVPTRDGAFAPGKLRSLLVDF